MMTELGCDQATALDHVNVLMTEMINNIADQQDLLCHQIVAAGASNDVQEQVTDCLQACRSVIKGNHDWHFEVGRYSAPEAVRDGAPLYTEELFANPSEG
ncbi:hypothetical protein [Streptomyces sp. NPDC054940]